MSSRANVTKRACDGCKIRKIRCGGGHPCKGCVNSRIKCTYIRVQQTRGPQQLRATTKLLIEHTQRESEAHHRGSFSKGDTLETDGALNFSSKAYCEDAERSRLSNNVIAPPLYIYHVRMYPVWPIVDVEQLVSSLQQDTKGEDLETYALATAVAAATIAQLRLGQKESITADTLVNESLRARSSSRYRSKVSLNNVRTSFFLHVYYENQQSGGSESLLYLREAISLAQMMNLHRESSYAGLEREEKQIRRRILWLLFVTERGVCILHKLPVILKTNIQPPDVDINDEPQVLPAFLKLLNLFRLFEQSKVFDAIEEEDTPIQSVTNGRGNLDGGFLENLQQKLQESSVLFDHFSDVQKADLCVTRHWMRVILWKLCLKKNVLFSSHSPASPSFPVAVAKELLNMVSHLPKPAIEAHGLGMELKLYEIASSLADAVMQLTMLPRAPNWDAESRPSNILSKLHSILSTFRGGGNKTLVDMLYKKMAEAQMRTGPVLTKSVQVPSTSPLLNNQSVETAEPVSNDDETTRAGQETPLVQPAPNEFEHFIAVIGSPPNHRIGPMYLSSGDGCASLQGDYCTGMGQTPEMDRHQTTLEDATQRIFAETTFSPPGVAYPPCTGGPSYILPQYPHTTIGTGGMSTLSPWPSQDSVEAMIGDFMSQIPDGQLSTGNIFDDLISTNELTAFSSYA